ncbi:hypothetical protein [Sphaerotilus montanus]|uniref:hypothetical protein n=1 Tax=Sphaerotilus montanus TaxID=522889 RepID=UPI003FA28373
MNEFTSPADLLRLAADYMDSRPRALSSEARLNATISMKYRAVFAYPGVMRVYCEITGLQAAESLPGCPIVANPRFMPEWEFHAPAELLALADDLIRARAPLFAFDERTNLGVRRTDGVTGQWTDGIPLRVTCVYPGVLSVYLATNGRLLARSKPGKPRQLATQGGKV